MSTTFTCNFCVRDRKGDYSGLPHFNYTQLYKHIEEVHGYVKDPVSKKLIKKEPGKGWSEQPDASGKAPEHVAAAKKTELKDTLRQPLSDQEKALPDAMTVWNTLSWYIKKHSSIEPTGIKIVFPWGYLITEEDVKPMQIAKKWVKEHGFQYDDRGYYWLNTRTITGVTNCQDCRKEKARFRFTSPEVIDLCIKCSDVYIKDKEEHGIKPTFDIIRPVRIEPQYGAYDPFRFSEEERRERKKSPKQIKNEELVAGGEYELCNRCLGSGHYSRDSTGNTKCYQCEGYGYFKKGDHANK